MADEYRQNKNYPTLLQQHNDNKNKVKNVRQLLKKKKHPDVSGCFFFFMKDN